MVKQFGIIFLSVIFMLAGTGLSPAWELPDTGQIACYDNNTYPITCPAEGEGFYGQDASYEINPQSYSKLDASGSVLSNDATDWVMVQDNVTGLIWEVKTADNKDSIYTWSEAETYASDLDIGGFSDWRLPTVKELSAIVKRDSEGSGDVWFAINRTYFNNTASGDYWTATDYAGNLETVSAAWTVDFNRSGRIRSGEYYGDKTITYYVRAVRGSLTPSPSLIADHDMQTVIDMSTSLMWQQIGSDASWENALSYCENLSVEDSGYDDWHLPNIIELQHLVDYKKYDMAIDTSAFPNTSTSGWSSTTRGDRGDHNHKLYLSFQDGSISYTSAGATATKSVRCVRKSEEGFSIGLREVILTLQAVAGRSVGVTYFEVNGDEKIGLEEAIYLLQYLAGLRSL